MKQQPVVNKLRALNFALGIMENQQEDPVCRECLSFAKTFEALMGDFMKIEKEISPLKEDLPEEFSDLFTGLYGKISLISTPESPTGQKKLGRCALGEVCLPKTGLAVLAKVAG